MLDVQLNIIWKFEWKQTIINDKDWEQNFWSIPEFSQLYYYDIINVWKNGRWKTWNNFCIKQINLGLWPQALGI